MPKTRLAAAHVVADAFLPIEADAQALAANAHRCVATMIEQRSRARLPANAGAKALALASEGANHLVAAVNAFAYAHEDLHALGVKVGVEVTFGTESPEEGNLVELSAFRTA
jgi:hypothetical protein